MIYSAALISASETTTTIDITGHGVYVSDSDIYAEQMTRTRAALYADVREVTDPLGITGMSKLPKFALAGMVADWATGTRQGQRELAARRAEIDASDAALAKAEKLADSLVTITLAMLEERGEIDPRLIHSTVKRVVEAWYTGDMQDAAGTDEWNRLDLECQAVLDAATRLLVNGKGICLVCDDTHQEAAQAAHEAPFGVVAEGFVYADGTVVGINCDVQVHHEPTPANLRYEVRPYGALSYGVYDNTRRDNYQLVTAPWDRESADNLAAKYNAVGNLDAPIVISRYGH